MSPKLPIRLSKEPLIDAIFEFRFTANESAADVIPGYLYGQLEGSKSIARLPQAELPKLVRDSDPNLRFSPVVKIDWNQFTIAIGDRVLVVACQLPYPGWRAFKPAILKVVKLIAELEVITAVHRFSMKYVDLIEAPSSADQISMTRLSMSLGKRQIRNEQLSLRVEFPENETVQVLSVVTSASAQLKDGTKRDGVVVDVDTIRNVGSIALNEWTKNLSESLEDLHSVNKTMFFDCLQPHTIESLGPVYE